MCEINIKENNDLLCNEDLKYVSFEVYLDIFLFNVYFV